MSIKSLLKKIIPSLRMSDNLRIMNEELSLEIDSLKISNQEGIKQLNKRNEYFFWLSQRREGESISDTKKRVFLALPKAEGDIRCIQLGSNYILQRLRDICDKKDIHFSLCGGTLLGAVRHQGFIPWDDDIDIAIEREHFPKLKSAIKEDSELTIDYYYTPMGEKTIKVRHKDSELFWVDIFPFDRIDIAYDEIDLMKNKIIKEHQKISQEIIKIMLTNEHFYITKKDQSIPELNSIFDEIYKKHKSKIPLNDNGKYCLSGFDNYNNPLVVIYEYEKCFPLCAKEVVFEGERYDVFNDYSHYLNRMYDDIYSFPAVIANHVRYNNSFEKEYDFLRKHNIIL